MTAAKPKQARKVAAKPVEIAAFKGFDKNLQCRGFQYEIGKTYTHDGDVVACASGFHACENPLDVLSYYDIGSDNRFCSVTLGGEVSRHGDDSKIAAARITIGAELRLPDFIKAAVAWIMAAAKGGDDQIQAASGDYSKLAASGYSSQLAASGNSSKLAASGYSSHLAASGDSSQLAASGDYSKLEITGENGVIAASALGCVAKGADGTWISLAEFDCNGKCVGFATGCTGKDGLEAGVSYVARGGKLVRA